MRRTGSPNSVTTRREQAAPTATDTATDTDREHDLDEHVNRLVRRLADAHRDLPEDLITRQVGEVRTALRWLGDDPDMKETLTKAVEHNLSQLEAALANGADLSGRPDRR